MKRTLAGLFLTLAALPALPQSSDQYYQHPNQRQSPEPLLSRYGQVSTQEQWYIGLEGFSRTDQNNLDQTFDGLVSTEPTTRTGWGALAGWVYRERWAVEGGYAHSAIHNNLQISNGSNPFKFHFDNDKHGFVLRGKRVLRFTGRHTPEQPVRSSSGRRAGLWLGAGLWLIPNSGRSVSKMAFKGYQSQGRFTRQDTLYLTTDTQISPKLTGLAELSAEFIVPVSRRAEFSLFLRRHWGLGNSITTNMAYTVNSNPTQLATLQGSGTGWSFGLSFRYIYGIRYDVKNRTAVDRIREDP